MNAFCNQIDSHAESDITTALSNISDIEAHYAEEADDQHGNDIAEEVPAYEGETQMYIAGEALEDDGDKEDREAVKRPKPKPVVDYVNEIHEDKAGEAWEDDGDKEDREAVKRPKPKLVVDYTIDGERWLEKYCEDILEFFENEMHKRIVLLEKIQAENDLLMADIKKWKCAFENSEERMRVLRDDNAKLKVRHAKLKIENDLMRHSRLWNSPDGNKRPKVED
jgi:hypothetical protein